MSTRRQNWWERREAVIALMVMSISPLVWPLYPPLVDLPGHMGRYAIEMYYDSAPQLREWYDFQWALIGNLGVDLLIIPVAKIFGIELGVKLIVIAIVALTVGGWLWISREVHGRISPTALFALPFAYGFPFMFGFVNFALSMALAMCAFALWLRMARLGNVRQRPVIFLPISIVLWVCHTYGWGMLGVLAFSAELVRQWDHRTERERPWWQLPFYAAWHCLPLAVPIVLMIVWRSGAVGGQTVDMFNWPAKTAFVTQTLRDRWHWFDQAALTTAFAVLLYGLASRRVEYSRNLAASAIFVAAVFVFLPRLVFGSNYADMRLTPFFFAIALTAIRPTGASNARHVAVLATLGLVFFLARTTGTTISFALSDRDIRSTTQALDHVPRGARLVSFVGDNPCRPRWLQNRFWHVPGLAIVRRQAFSNDQWDLPGAQLLRVKAGAMSRYAQDPSQVVEPDRCPDRDFRTMSDQLRDLPRAAFDYIWLIKPYPLLPELLDGTTRIWTDGTSALYRIDRLPVRPAAETSR